MGAASTYDHQRRYVSASGSPGSLVRIELACPGRDHLKKTNLEQGGSPGRAAGLCCSRDDPRRYKPRLTQSVRPIEDSGHRRRQGDAFGKTEAEALLIRGGFVRRLLRPFRADLPPALPCPRALPWAGLFQPFGLGKVAVFRP